MTQLIGYYLDLRTKYFFRSILVLPLKTNRNRCSFLPRIYWNTLYFDFFFLCNNLNIRGSSKISLIAYLKRIGTVTLSSSGNATSIANTATSSWYLGVLIYQGWKDLTLDRSIPYSDLISLLEPTPGLTK
jgi:hypothetical protein